MTEMRYINLGHNDLTQLPSTICDIPSLTTLELLGNSLDRLPDCLCESDVVTSLSPSAEMLREQPDCLPRGNRIPYLDGWMFHFPTFHISVHQYNIHTTSTLQISQRRKGAELLYRYGQEHCSQTQPL